MLRAQLLNTVKHFLDLLHVGKVYSLFDANDHNVGQRLGIREN
jgi:hypothetical protein